MADILFDQDSDGEIDVTQETTNTIEITSENDDSIIDVVTPDPGDIQMEADSTEDEELEVERTPRNILSYLRLTDKPSINEVTLINDKSFEELGLSEITNTELEALLEDD